MYPEESERLWGLVRTLLRQPEAVDDAEARRALTVLTAARPDAAYLLLQRALVLELALQRVRGQHALAGGEARPPGVPAAPAAPSAPGGPPGPARSSPFVRDAVTVAAGVVAGGLVLGTLDGLGEQLGGDDLGLADWL